jgi:hypothetical protein
VRRFNDPRLVRPWFEEINQHFGACEERPCGQNHLESGQLNVKLGESAFFSSADVPGRKLPSEE